MSATASDGTPYSLDTSTHGDSAPCHADPPACGCVCGSEWGESGMTCTRPPHRPGDPGGDLHTAPTEDDDGVWAWA